METIFINQKQIINLHLGLDLIDGTIIQYIASAIRSDSLNRMPHPEGGYQYLVNSAHLKTQIPILNIEVRTIKEHLKNMVDVGVFNVYRIGYGSYYKPMPPFYKVTT